MICPRCNSPNFNRVGSYGRGIKADYFECADCGYSEEGGKKIRQVHHNYKSCPRCGGKDVHPAYRRQGYKECEKCGYQWT
jgi:transposase-like protein